VTSGAASQICAAAAASGGTKLGWSSPAVTESSSVAEGWYRDPYGIHQDRWFSAGTPTSLVRDCPLRGLATGAGANPLLQHSTSYYVGLSLVWAAGIFVMFGLLAALRFARR
jgi:hypothetical protein